ncbi:MAG: sulfatase-like hydrolase/transferase [Planctomycetes bacterium]|nr:sulfatase-like hydrolase/transferase [Planctomycetota bacterium]
MRRRDFIKLAGLGAASLALGGCAEGFQKLSDADDHGFADQPKQPNIVVILADDLGYQDVGFNGCTDFSTPNIDSLAKQGVKFTHGYVTHAFCAPTRAGLMTGRYQQRFGFETNPVYDVYNTHIGLPASEVIITERLKKVGYRTGMVGKWHLGASHSHHPNNRGFDDFFGFLSGGHDYFKVDVTKPVHEGYLQPLMRNTKPADVEGYLTDQLSDEATGFIDRNKDKPFFLYVSYNAPHTPLQAPKETIKKYSHIKNKQRRVYAAMVDKMDEGIGRIIDSVKRNNISERTLVFFLSDNGGPLNKKDPQKSFTSNDPLRGGKGALYEGGVHVPFVAYWPGKLKAGQVYENPIISLDITRTTASLAGADETNLEGVDLIPYLTGDKKGSPHDYLYFRRRNGVIWSIVSNDKQKLIKPVWSDKHVEYYDLNSDLSEKNDLIAVRSKEAKTLREKWKEWDKSNIKMKFIEPHTYRKHAEEFYKTVPKH